MFNWFKSKEERTKDYNVIKFPAPVVAPSSLHKESEEHYSIGVTGDRSITLKLGYSTLTMNERAARNLIEQLELFADHLAREPKND
jgi:hypothetical protein